jgi:hypothetical protein
MELVPENLEDLARAAAVADATTGDDDVTVPDGLLL